MLSAEFWAGFLLGYLFSVLVETPVLLLGLSARHSRSHRLFAGVWLTACTYPTVYLILPPLLYYLTESRIAYLAIAETFAPIAECLLFWAAFGTRAEWGRWSMWRDFLTIAVANLASFALAEVARWAGWRLPDLGA
jgi:hypothetical protein